MSSMTKYQFGHRFGHWPRSIPAIGVAALLGLAACDAEPLPGTLTMTIYGEEYIEEGIGAEEFVDGWEVTFDRFLVVVTETRGFQATETAPAVEGDVAVQIFNLAEPSMGSGQVVSTSEVPGGHYDRFSYHIQPLPSVPPGEIGGNASQADIDVMSGGGLSVYVEGTAVKDAETKTFSWRFVTDTRYSDCHAAAGAGIDIDGDDASVEFTIHGDHLFYDDLVSSEPNVAFQLIADADTNLDGDISESELRSFDISSQERYQTGSNDIRRLFEFIDYQVGTLGHIDGEGHCDGTTTE